MISVIYTQYDAIHSMVVMSVHILHEDPPSAALWIYLLMTCLWSIGWWHVGLITHFMKQKSISI